MSTKPSFPVKSPVTRPRRKTDNKKTGIRAITLCLAALVMTAVLLTLPLFHFNATVFSKKYANTDVGSEKYIAAREEVEQIAASYGPDAKIGETLTLRTNSKGVTSTLVTFTITAGGQCSGWHLISSGLPAGNLLLAAALLALVSAALSILSWRLEPIAEPSRMKKGHRRLRTFAVLLGVAAMVLVPTVSMSMNRLLNREISLALLDGRLSELEPLTDKLDRMLFGGQAGDLIAVYLAGMTFRPCAIYWLLLPVLFLLVPGGLLMRDGEVKTGLSKLLLYLFIICVCVIVLYPYYAMFITAFRSAAETNDMEFRHMFPTRWIWSNLTDIVNRGVLTYLLNSLMLSAGATAIALVCGIPAAYAMARMKFKGQKLFLGFVIMSQMFSPVVLLVGISQLMNTFKLNDTLLGLMLINAAFNQAFAIWLLRGTFVSISSEMEQAACIDGCSIFGAMVRVLLPMAAPGIVTTLIFVFINSWNEYTISTVLISTPALRPITVGITQFSSFNMIEWQYLFAAALVATVPVVILFMCIEKHLAAGLTAGGVKG